MTSVRFAAQPTGGADLEPMVRVRGLAKTYSSRRGPVEAVKGVDFDVAPGEIVGFLGPNGAGKSTTLHMLTTLLAPTAGSATIAGHDLLTDPVNVRRRVGLVAQGGSAASEARVAEELEFQARFYGIDAPTARQRTAILIEQFELSGLADREVRTLSGGQRRRLDIALGLVHAPALVFLDEPTTGLDPQSRANMWRHIADLRRELSTTVFITTHYLDEADALCDRLLVIDHGQIVATGTPDELKAQVSGDLVTITVRDDPAPALEQIRSNIPAAAVDQSGRRLSFRVPHGEQVAIDAIRRLDHADIALDGIAVTRPTLDDVFLTLTGRSLRDDPQESAADLHTAKAS